MSRSRGFTDVPIRRSALLGFLAYVVGYAATYLFVRGRVMTVLNRATIAEGYLSAKPIAEVLQYEPPTWAAAGWFFYNAHWTALQVPKPTGPGGDPGGGLGMSAGVLVNPIFQLGGIFWVVVAIPVVTLFLAGLAVVYYTNPSTLRGGVYTGAAIFLGYGPLATVGAWVFTLPTGRGIVTPDLLFAFMVAGFVYPFFIGGLAGWVGYHLTERFRPNEERDDVSAFKNGPELSNGTQ